MKTDTRVQNVQLPEVWAEAGIASRAGATLPWSRGLPMGNMHHLARMARRRQA